MDNRPKSCNRVTITTSKYRPFIKPELHRPLAPSVTCGDSSLPEGAIGLVPCYIGLCFWGSACWGIPQSKIKDFCQLPQAGSLAASGRRQCARWLSTIRYLPDLPGIVTEQNGERKYRYYARIASGGTPPRPVSLPSKMGNENIGTVHALTAAARRHYSLKNPPLCRRITT